MPSLLSKLAEEIHALDPRRFEGRVTGLSGALVEVTGPVDALALGARVTIYGHTIARGEIVGFRGDRALIAPYDSIESIRPGSRVVLEGASPMARPSHTWLGRVIDCFGNPVDGQGPLPQGLKPTPVRAPPPSAHDRARVGGRLDLPLHLPNPAKPESIAFREPSPLSRARRSRAGVLQKRSVGPRLPELLTR